MQSLYNPISAFAGNYKIYKMPCVIFAGNEKEIETSEKLF